MEKSPILKARKEARSFTSPSKMHSIESSFDLKQMVEPPPGLSTSAKAEPTESNECVDTESLIQNLQCKLEFFTKKNQEITEEIQKCKKIVLPDRKWEIDEILKKFEINYSDKELKIIEKLKEKLDIVLETFYELYSETKEKPVSEDSSREILELKETIRLMRVEHSREMHELALELKSQHQADAHHYASQIEELTTALRNIKLFLQENAPNMKLEILLQECGKCLEKTAEIDALTESLGDPTATSLKLLSPSVCPPNKHINSLFISVNSLEASLLPVTPFIRKKLEDIKSTISVLKDQKPYQLSSCRNLRSQIHRQVVLIESDFEDLKNPAPEVLALKKKYLELPFLLKPLFDLTKTYEQDVPVVVYEPANSENKVHNFLCKVAEGLGGVVKVQDIEMVLANYSQLVSELREAKLAAASH